MNFLHCNITLGSKNLYCKKSRPHHWSCFEDNVPMNSFPICPFFSDLYLFTSRNFNYQNRSTFNELNHIADKVKNTRLVKIVNEAMTQSHHNFCWNNEVDGVVSSVCIKVQLIFNQVLRLHSGQNIRQDWLVNLWNLHQWEKWNI